MKVRATLRLRNDAMIKARHKLGLSQVALSQLCEVPIDKVTAFEKFHIVSKATAIEEARKIAFVLEIDPVDIVSQEMLDMNQEFKSDHERTLELTIEQLSTVDNNQLRLEAKTEDNLVTLSEVHEEVESYLDCLLDREKYILKQRYGLIDGYARTLEEIGRELRVTQERVRQIEFKAIAKVKERKRQIEARESEVQCAARVKAKGLNK